ncbi:hypothetical protein K502DRAFT_349573 [Neoconidiobolus thromboides FSU 785]|nr:hypothetical protein K502DRAFT_349573 [Neoconidiobolus thromboides FSU 785]
MKASLVYIPFLLALNLSIPIDDKGSTDGQSIEKVKGAVSPQLQSMSGSGNQVEHNEQRNPRGRNLFRQAKAIHDFGSLSNQDTQSNLNERNVNNLNQEVSRS